MNLDVMNMLSIAIDEYNTSCIEEVNSEEKVFVCKICRKQVAGEDSVSHKGYNLVCMKCVSKIADVLGNRSTIIKDIQAHGTELEKEMMISNFRLVPEDKEVTS